MPITSPLRKSIGSPLGPKAPGEPGFTGIAPNGHKYVNGRQVAIGQDEPAVEQPKVPEQPATPEQQSPDAKAEAWAKRLQDSFGDQAMERLEAMKQKYAGDEAKLNALNLVAAKLQSSSHAEQIKEVHGDKAHAKVDEAIKKVTDAGGDASKLESIKESLGPQDQAKINDTKRANMDPQDYIAAKKAQYLKTDRGEAEEFREQSDAEEDAKRKKEDDEHKAKKEAMEARHGEEWAAAEAKVDAIQSRRDQLESERDAQDAADEEARKKEDEDFADKTTAEEESLQKSRDAEDEATESERVTIRDQLTTAWTDSEDGSPEELRTKKALDDAEAKWEKEDEKRDDKRGKYDDKATADYEKANEKREADREKSDEKIRKARDAEDKKLDKAESKVESERDKLEEKHRNEIDDLDQEETDRENEGEKDDEQVRGDREEEDAGFDEQDEKEAEEGTALIDSFEETDDAPSKPPTEQLDAVRKYNEEAAKDGKRNRITWYDGKAFQGWANENIEDVTYDNFDRFQPHESAEAKPLSSPLQKHIGKIPSPLRVRK